MAGRTKSPPMNGEMTMRTWPERAHIAVKMESDYACFSRPDFQAEKFSYPILTPTAAVGALESVFWKPQMRWNVRRITMLSMPEWFRYRINGQQEKGYFERFRKGSHGDLDEERTQINHMLLTRPSYIVDFTAEILPEKCTRDGDVKDVLGVIEQTKRRLRRGSFHRPPYLGMKEHLAHLSLPDGDETPVPFTQPLGPMPLWIEHLAHTSGKNQGEPNGKVNVHWFDAVVLDGVMEVPVIDR